jgi:hypothetical protein
MMKNLTTILIAAAALGTVSCKKEVIGNGPVTAQTRTVQAFNGIDLRMNGYVYYTNSNTVKVEVVAPQSLHSIIETNVVNNQLVVRYSTGKTYDADDRIRINVSAPNVTSLQLNTSGSIYCLNDMQPANLYLHSSGSGDISLQKVVTNTLEIASTQSGRITAGGGIAVTEKLKTDGSGRIDVSAVATRNATARTIGSGDISLRVSDNLDVTIDGSGSVYFSGYPALSSHISGSGHIVRL